MQEKALSIGGTTLEIQNRSGYVILIDILYTSDLKERVIHLDIHTGERTLVDDVIRIEEIAFPYGEHIIGVLSCPASHFILPVEAIRCSDYREEVAKEDRSVFCTDTGLIGFVDAGAFQEFIQNIDYDELVDSLEYVDMVAYVRKLHEKIGGMLCGFILAPGVDSGYSFEGSGRYRVALTSS